MPLYLKEWRTALGITRDALAQLIDKSVPTIQRWESGVRTPGVDDIDMLARVLEISPYELLLNPKDAFSLRNATTLTPEERALLEQFRSSPPQARRTAHAVLDAWKEYKDDQVKENKVVNE